MDLQISPLIFEK